MSGLQNGMTKDIILEIYKDSGTVYRFNDIAMLVVKLTFNRSARS